MECLKLRVQDIDFGYQQITVHDGKGAKDRFVPLPAALAPSLQEQIRASQRMLTSDLAAGFGEVSMPESLVRKYPRAPFELKWWYVFPASGRSPDPITGRIKRHHIDPSAVQKAMRAAVMRAGISQRATPHTLGPCFETVQVRCSAAQRGNRGDAEAQRFRRARPMGLFHLTLLCAPSASPRLCGKKSVNLANCRDSCTVFSQRVCRRPAMTSVRFRS